jgi:hypothetical protein
MPDANEKKKHGICPNCHHELHYLDQRQASLPFWHTLPKFFLLPCAKEPLLILTVSALLALSFLGHPAIAIVAAILIAQLVTHYGYQIINKEKFTLKSPPGLSLILSFQNFKNSLLVSLFLGLTILIPILAAHYTNFLFSIVLGTVIFWFLPAATMVKLRAEKFDNTLRIDNLLEPMIRMKWTYFGLVCGMIIAFITSLVIIDFSHQHLPKIMTPLISAVSFSYFSLVMFSILAYVLVEYKSFSNIKPLSPLKNSNANKIKTPLESDQIKRRDADIDIALKQGNYTKLVTQLENELKRRSFSDLRSDQLYKLLCALNDHHRLEKYAHSFLTLLLGRGKIDNAAQFIQSRLAHNANFVLYDLSLSKRLADAFHEHQMYQLVIWLANKAHIRFDATPELAELYLRAAKTLLTKLLKKNEALEYLNYIVAHFPDQPAAESAKILQKLINKSY